MAIFVLNGVTVQIVAPLSLEERYLTRLQRTEAGNLVLAKHGDTDEVRSFQVQTDFLTTTQKDALEDELLASGPATISGDIFGTSISAYVFPIELRAGPLTNQWVWTFDVEEVS